MLRARGRGRIRELRCFPYLIVSQILDNNRVVSEAWKVRRGIGRIGKFGRKKLEGGRRTHQYNQWTSTPKLLGSGNGQNTAFGFPGLVGRTFMPFAVGEGSGLVGDWGGRSGVDGVGRRERRARKSLDWVMR